MYKIFNTLGSGLILFAFLLTGFTLLTGVSWLIVADTIGKLVLDKSGQLKMRIKQNKTVRQQPKVKQVVFQAGNEAQKIESPKPAIIRVEPKMRVNENEEEKKSLLKVA